MGFQRTLEEIWTIVGERSRYGDLGEWFMEHLMCAMILGDQFIFLEAVDGDGMSWR